MPLATRRDIGQFLIGSIPGRTMPVEMRSLAREFDLGGVILFSRNIEAPEQVAELAAEGDKENGVVAARATAAREGLSRSLDAGRVAS